jgi:hypothetical protein
MRRPEEAAEAVVMAAVAEFRTPWAAEDISAAAECT